MTLAHRRCPKCGSVVGALDKFCGMCGTKTTRLCPKCDHEVPIELSYCNYCGFGLTPVEVKGSLNPTERIQLFRNKELEILRSKEAELRENVEILRRKLLMKRTLGLLTLILVGAVLIVAGIPLFQESLDQLFRDSPAKVVALSILFCILLMLIVMYPFESSREKDRVSLEMTMTNLRSTEIRIDELRTVMAAEATTRVTSPAKKK